MIVSLEDLKKTQSEFRAEVSSYLKEGKSIRSIRHEQFLKGITDDLEVLITLTISSTAKTDLDNLHNFYSHLAGWLHIKNQSATDDNSVIYLGIQQLYPL